MKYIGYIIILIAAIAGFYRFYPAIMVVLALVSTFVMSTDRKKHVTEQTKVGRPNMIIDGMYLFFVQLLIIFVVYFTAGYAGIALGNM